VEPMDDDFVRLKSLLELGKTRSREGKQVTYDRESHSARLAEQSV
jgi:hypothetical protein